MLVALRDPGGCSRRRSRKAVVMSVRLRAHHLLCMLTFAGEGYSPEFVANLAAIVARVGAGEPVELVDGPDDVCAPLDGTDAHCHEPSVRRRDREALRQLTAAEPPLSRARPLVFDRTAIAELRAHFAAGTIRAACNGCAWSALCTGIASAGYAATRL
jgi:hypothetical protein